MIARLVALLAAIAAVFFGVRVYRFSGGLDAPDLRTDLVLLAASILVCVVALKLARKKSRSGKPR